jgi:hypothetical protein
MKIAQESKPSRRRGTYTALTEAVATPDAAAPPRKALFDTPQAAEYLSVSTDTLNGWRVKGVGPRFVKLASGGSRAPIRYRLVDLDAFIENGLRSSTRDAGHAVGAR